MPLRKKKRKISMWGEVVLAAEDERDFSQFSQCPNIKKKKKYCGPCISSLYPNYYNNVA